MTDSIPRGAREVDFTEGWTMRRAGEDDCVAVRLPHDAMIHEVRHADARSSNHGAFFPGGAYIYEKTWRAPASLDGRVISLIFEGVYGATTVSVNGQETARWHSEYREVEVDITGLLTPSTDVVLRVDVDNSLTPNSRWYSGSGIYRPVWLRDTSTVHIGRDGLQVTTEIENGTDGRVNVALRVEDAPADAVAELEIMDERGAVVEAADQLSEGCAAFSLVIPEVSTWSAESPNLYTITATIRAGGDVVDRVQEVFGVRTLEVDARHGLRINSETVLLRGACVHHDNGVLGAATHAAAEWRRARLLKENGFNAIRSSHNPLSRAFLDACDHLGLYVVDELTDVWIAPKTPHDASHRFEQNWRDDIRSMVAKDRNRPSVIMYSTGNEIAETATEDGVRVAGSLAGEVKRLDPTRPTTLALNFMLNVLASFGRSAFQGDADATETKPAASSENRATSTLINGLFSLLGPAMQQAARVPRADRFTRRALSTVDVAGYNYAFLRYRSDRTRHPDRVIVGSESMPGDILRIWELVESVPGVIGDFMWTGWDYLGEAGIGIPSYVAGEGGMGARFPALLAGPGAIDILGVPGAPMLLARAVWGIDTRPAIAVRPVDRRGKKPRFTPWRTTDAIQSWTWPGWEGAHAYVEVYAVRDATEVELTLNGRSLGRKKTRDCVAHFATTYQPGTLTAVVYGRGGEISRSTLTTARAARLRLRAEKQDIAARRDGLWFVWVECADEQGVIDATATDEVTLSLGDDLSLEGFGSAAPATRENFTDTIHSLYRGRALAVVRTARETSPTTLHGATDRHGSVSVTLAS